jgi:hypothetical protein
MVAPPQPLIWCHRGDFIVLSPGGIFHDVACYISLKPVSQKQNPGRLENRISPYLCGISHTSQIPPKSRTTLATQLRSQFKLKLGIPSKLQVPDLDPTILSERHEAPCKLAESTQVNKTPSAPQRRCFFFLRHRPHVFPSDVRSTDSGRCRRRKFPC